MKKRKGNKLVHVERLSYWRAHKDAEERMARGEVQRKCPCGFWLWIDEECAKESK